MSSALKKRKSHLIPVTTASQIKPQYGLHTYLKVSKATTTVGIVPEKNSKYSDSIAPADKLSKSRKRKLVTIEAESSSAPTNHNVKIRRRSSNSENPKTPCRPIQLERQENSSTKRARGLLDNFFISSTPKRLLSGSESLNSNSIKSPLRNPLFSQPGPSDDLIDLVNLNSAFLTAFSIHCAHNGTHCPADQKIICQEVARVWRKRSVNLRDLQRILGVANISIEAESENWRKVPRLVLSDYGHGRICIEVSETKGNLSKVARPVNVDRMKTLFLRSLNSEWKKWNGVDIQDFVDNLPLEPITRCSSYLKVSPLLAKGQRRLEIIRDGNSNKKQLSNEANGDANGKKTTLLERLRAKQLQDICPSPPPKSEILRKVSLAKLEQVVAVLKVLSTMSSTSQKRVSFTMMTVLEKLKDSIQISHSEGELCINLIAAEIAPEWIKIVSLKKNEAVVVDKDARPEDSEVRERVRKAEMM